MTLEQEVLFGKFSDWVQFQHRNQVRKYTGDPYFNHCQSVRDLYAQYFPEDFVGKCIALGHDLIEDTEIEGTCRHDKFITVFEKLEEIGFNASNTFEISVGILQLTDEFTSAEFPELNRAERKIRESERLATIPSDIQSIKYCDLIDNCKSIVQHDEKFAKVYLEEKRYLLEKMNLGNQELYQICLELSK